MKNRELEKALENYNLGLMLEPNNTRTIESIHKLENAIVAKLENHPDLEEEIPDSDEEPTIEDVEDPIGGMWADLDQLR